MCTYLATAVNNHLALEEKIKVWGLLALHHTHLHGSTAVLVIKGLGPDGRGAFLVLLCV